MALYVGMDAGGSRSRAAVIEATGALRGAAVGPGANPVAHTPDRTFDALAGTLRAALAGLPPTTSGSWCWGWPDPGRPTPTRPRA
ncbi:hypothetical protein [Pseudonocardia sp. DLS-67]